MLAAASVAARASRAAAERAVRIRLHDRGGAKRAVAMAAPRPCEAPVTMITRRSCAGGWLDVILPWGSDLLVDGPRCLHERPHNRDLPLEQRLQYPKPSPLTLLNLRREAI